MTVAVTTDTHANLPALQVALALADELGIERIYPGSIHEYGGVVFVNCGSVGNPRTAGLPAELAEELVSAT